MKLEDIQAEWDKDSEIDRLALDSELAKVPKLHKKYWDMLINERMRLRVYESQLKELTNDKFWFFMQGHDEDTRAKGWELPPRGKIFVKDEAKQLVDVDKEVIALTLKVAAQREKSLYLEDIVKSIHGRTWTIRSMIDFMKFQAGG
jgi:hypothetical protein